MANIKILNFIKEYFGKNIYIVIAAGYALAGVWCATGAASAVYSLTLSIPEIKSPESFLPDTQSTVHRERDSPQKGTEQRYQQVLSI